MFGQSNHSNEITTPLKALIEIRDHLESLTGEEKTLAEYIILNYALVPQLSLVQLAEEAHVAPGTIRRFCQDLGFDGYHSLHNALAQIDSVAASVFFEGIPYPRNGRLWIF